MACHRPARGAEIVFLNPVPGTFVKHGLPDHGTHVLSTHLNAEDLSNRSLPLRRDRLETYLPPVRRMREQFAERSVTEAITPNSANRPKDGTSSPDSPHSIVPLQRGKFLCFFQNLRLAHHLLRCPLCDPRQAASNSINRISNRLANPTEGNPRFRRH